MTGIYDDYRQRLEALRADGRLRCIPDSYVGDPIASIDLLSNDYMALAAHETDFYDEFHNRFADAQFTSAAARLLSRRQKYHALLEQKLESLYGRPALLFNSGYHANTGILNSLSSADTLIISDRLIHASSIDGIRIAGHDFKRFRHNDIDNLENIMRDNAARYKRFVIAVESVYSMDGDLAPLHNLVNLKKEWPQMIICLDEAHGFGVRGELGLGLAEECGLIDEIDIIIGTLGKAAASAGAFVIADPVLISLFVNTARSFIFSTTLPPVNMAWSLLMIEKLNDMQAERRHLQQLSAKFTTALSEATGYKSPSQSQIVPLITGNAATALLMAEKCRAAGFDCMAIRRPTVPPNGDRIRFSLNASLDYELISPLITLLKR